VTAVVRTKLTHGFWAFSAALLTEALSGDFKSASAEAQGTNRNRKLFGSDCQSRVNVGAS